MVYVLHLVDTFTCGLVVGSLVLRVLQMLVIIVWMQSNEWDCSFVQTETELVQSVLMWILSSTAEKRGLVDGNSKSNTKIHRTCQNSE